MPTIMSQIDQTPRSTEEWMKELREGEENASA